MTSASPSLSTRGLDALDWDKAGGLIPGVVQDARTDAVLMVGWFSPESLAATLERRRVVFYSRSKQRLWEKGETSGNTLVPESIVADCDADTLLLRVRPAGPACHRGTTTCFGDGLPPAGNGFAFLGRLEEVLASRIAEQPEGSYTARLYAQGTRRMAQKVGEEGVEVALAAAGDERALVGECADLLYHLALLLRSRGLSLADVTAELAARHRRGAGTEAPRGD